MEHEHVFFLSSEEHCGPSNTYSLQATLDARRNAESSLESFHRLRRKFSNNLAHFKFNNFLTSKEQHIIQDAENGRYQAKDIEAAFYKHGGIEGILVLLVYFRNSEEIKRDWSPMAEDFRKSFVDVVVKLLDREIVSWYLKFLEIRGPLPPLAQPLRVGRHAGRRREAPQQDAQTPTCQKEPIVASSIRHIIIPELLHTLDSSQVPQHILFYGIQSQNRYDHQGHLRKITLHDAGFAEDSICLFSSSFELEKSIELAIQSNLIVRGVSKEKHVVYSVSEKSLEYISRFSKHSDLQFLGPRFIAYIFPRDQVLDPCFQTKGKALLPYLDRVWELVLAEPRHSVPADLLESLIDASLATYKLSEKPRSMDIMSLLSNFQGRELPDYLRMATVTRESILLRFRGDHDQSTELLHNTLTAIVTNWIDTRTYCAYGQLLLSEAENAILRKEFSRAKGLLERWEVKGPVSNPSILELQVIRLKNTVLGRVSRYEGDFPHSRHCLERCLDMVSSEASRFHIKHHLGDVYCELGIPEEAAKLVCDDIEKLRTRGKQFSKGFRRLALPLVESYIRQQQFQLARAVILDLLAIFERLAVYDVSDQLGHVRAVIGLARIERSQMRWSEAREGLEEALRLTESYKTFSDGNYYIGVIYLFLSIVNFELHHYPEARLARSSANYILRVEQPRHFIPGLGSYFLEELVRARYPL